MSNGAQQLHAEDFEVKISRGERSSDFDMDLTYKPSDIHFNVHFEKIMYVHVTLENDVLGNVVMTVYTTSVLEHKSDNRRYLLYRDGEDVFLFYMKQKEVPNNVVQNLILQHGDVYAALNPISMVHKQHYTLEPLLENTDFFIDANFKEYFNINGIWLQDRMRQVYRQIKDLDIEAAHQKYAYDLANQLASSAKQGEAK